MLPSAARILFVTFPPSVFSSHFLHRLMIGWGTRITTAYSRESST
jgi:hypothetical protein